MSNQRSTFLSMRIIATLAILIAGWFGTIATTAAHAGISAVSASHARVDPEPTSPYDPQGMTPLGGNGGGDSGAATTGKSATTCADTGYLEDLRAFVQQRGQEHADVYAILTSENVSKSDVRFVTTTLDDWADSPSLRTPSGCEDFGDAYADLVSDTAAASETYAIWDDSRNEADWADFADDFNAVADDLGRFNDLFARID